MSRTGSSFARWVAVAVALAAAGVALLFVLGAPASYLGASVGDMAELVLGVELTRGRFRLELSEGLVLEDAEALAVTEGRRYRFELPRVVFEMRPASLFSGAPSIHRILLEEPVLELLEVEEDRLETPAKLPEEKGWLEPRFELEEVVLEDATVRLAAEDGDGEPAVFEGVDVVLSEVGVAEGGSTLLALTGSGTFTAERASLGDVELTDARAEIFLHDQKVSLTLLNFESAPAPFVAEMRVELERSPFGYQVSSLGEPFDAAPLLGAEPGALGEASLLLEVFGRGPTPEGFRAQGSVTIPAASVSEAQIFAAVNDAVGRAVFEPGAPLGGTLAIYRVRDGYVVFEPFDLAAGDDRATVRGRAFLDGRLELEIEMADGTVVAIGGTIPEPEARVKFRD